jgi:hypothetical protein
MAGSFIAPYTKRDNGTLVLELRGRSSARIFLHLPDDTLRETSALLPQICVRMRAHLRPRGEQKMKRIIVFAAWCCICCAGAVWAQAPGRPLRDIRLLENISFVMKEGKVYKSGGLAK